jgi:hypothetical protein
VTCEGCGAELPAIVRRNRRYCDASCRQRALRKRRRESAERELAPVLQITDDQQVEELLARVLAEERLIAQVAAGAKTNWRAAAWILERRYPERWAPVRRPQAEPELPAVDGDDPFAEVDMLAAKRRARQQPDA